MIRFFSEIRVLRSKNDDKPQRKRQSRSENRKRASDESKQKRKEIRKSRLNSDTGRCMEFRFCFANVTYISESFVFK
jgi:hypothetical protein